VKRELILSSLWDKLWISNDKSTLSALKSFISIKLSTENQVLIEVEKPSTSNHKLLITIKLYSIFNKNRSLLVSCETELYTVSCETLHEASYLSTLSA